MVRTRISVVVCRLVVVAALVSAAAVFAQTDVTPPTVSVTSPAAGTTVSRTVNITATANDDVGVAGVRYTLDGVGLGAEDTTAPYSFAWNTQGAPDLLFGVVKVAVAVAITPGSGFTKRVGIACRGCAGADTVSEDTVQTASGDAAATFTFSTPAHYLAQMAAFKAVRTPTYVQGGGNSQQRSASKTIKQAFGGPVTAGNLIVAAIACQTDVPIIVTDNRANAYSVATSQYDAVNDQRVAIVYAANAIGGPTTVTVSFGNATPIVQRLEIHEYAGIATASPLDVTAMNIGDGSTTANAVTTGATATTVMPLVPDGQHTLVAIARDAAGNTGASSPVTLTVNNGDATPPAVSITAPAGGANVAGTVTVAASASDNVGVAGVQFKVDGVPLSGEDTTAPFSASWITTAASNGSHVLTATARDGGGNQTTSAAVTVTVANNVAPPVISLVTASSITASAATITWSTDTASNSQIEYGLTIAYGSQTTVNANLVTLHTATLVGLAGSTTYHYRVRSVDGVGNLAVAGDFTFTTLDGTAPSVSISAPSAGATVSGMVNVTATAGDNVGVSGVQFKLDGADVGSERTVAPYSMPWNTQGAPDLVFGVVKVAAVVTITPGSGFIRRLGVSCPSCAGADTVSEDKVLSASGAAAATFTLSGSARYLAQMAAFKSSGAPAYVQGAANTQQNSAATSIGQTFGVPVVAGHLIVAAVAWQTNAPMSATDSRGNVYATATTAYDAVNDQSVAILYAANVTGGATTVTVSFGPAAPSVQRLEIHEYSGIATTSPLDVGAKNVSDGLAIIDGVTSGSAMTTGTAGVSNGLHMLSAKARDAAGNITTSSLVSVTVNNGGDTAAPVISAVAVSSLAASAATVKWTTNEVSNSEVEYGPTSAYGGFSTLDVSLTALHTMPLSGLTPNTLYHFRVRSRDAAGNLALSGDFTLTTLEGTPPAVSITAPVSGATVSGIVAVTANASDNVGVAGVLFQVDGVPIGVEDVSAPYSVSWDTAGASPGGHTLTAVARDAAGNRTTSTPVAATVANVSVNVSLAWNPNSELNLAGYTIHYGTVSGLYTVAIDVGNVTSCTITGLLTGIQYFFSATSYNSSGGQSGFSNEVSAIK